MLSVCLAEYAMRIRKSCAKSVPNMFKALDGKALIDTIALRQLVPPNLAFDGQVLPPFQNWNSKFQAIRKISAQISSA
jgi:hypothetical protein